MKKLISAMLAMAMCFSLAACGAKEEPAPAPAPAPEASQPAEPAPAPAESAADKYPEKAVKIIIPYGAGGSTDMGGRVVASCMPGFLPGNYVVENQAGGAAIPGTLAVAQEAADGYTLGYNWYASFNFRPQFMETNYTMDDFTMICGTTIQANTLFIRADETRYTDVESLIAYINAHPGELNFSCGAANSWQLLVALGFLNAYDAADKVVEVPYTSARESALALMAGDVDFALLETATFTAELKSGDIKPICSYESNRNESAHPDCPTIGELGHPEVAEVAANRIVICGPAGMDPEVVAKIEAAVAKMCEDENFLMLSKNCNQVIDFKTSAEVTTELKEGMDDVKDLMIAAGIIK